MSEVAKTKPLRHLIGNLTGSEQLRVEKNRLEAFLAAMPGEYCGFSKDGGILYSQNFLSLLNTEKIESIFDIQNALKVSDSAALENAFQNLQKNGKDFTQDVHIKSNNKFLNLSGTRGIALDKTDYFDIIWLKDITNEKQQVRQLEQSATLKTDEIRRLQTVLDTMSEAFWLRDDSTNIIWVNKAYTQLVKGTPDSIVRNQDELILKPKEKTGIKTIKALAKEATSQNKILKIKGHIVSKGKRLFIEVTETPLADHKQTLGMLRDITAAEEASTEYDRHLTANETLLEQLRTAVAIYNADQELEFYNSAFAQLWGLEDQWLNSGPKLGDLLEKLRETRRLPEQADFKNYKQGWLDMFTRLIDPLDDMLYLPDGSALRMLVMPHPVGGLMMTFEDVTSNLELESSYNTLIAVQRETLDNLSEGVAVFGSDGRLKLYNPSYMELWQLHPEDMEGNPHITKLVDRMMNCFDSEKHKAKKEKLIAHAIERTVQEGRIKLLNNILLKYATVPLPDGGVLVSYFDVTDSVKVENALREKNAALEAAEQLKTDFLVNVSYQLRTPLNAIMGFAEILDNQYFGDLNTKQREYSGGIQEAGSKLVRLIDDILDLSTIEAGYLELSYNEFNVYEMLHGLHELTEEWALKESINIQLDCTKTIGSIIADKRRIKQVLLNLIHNAINFTPENGKIKISAKIIDDYIHFTVSDTGIGISKTDLQRIFEPFGRAIHEHRADMSAHALSRGAGLGLSLVKNIVELHDGHVEISSEEGKGTSVTLKIPKSIDIEAEFDDLEQLD